MIGVGLMSKTKIEQKAITKIRDIIDSIELFTYHFNEMDKDISWDGNINMYHENIDKKENFDSSIDVQIKGRTTPNKKLNSKHRFSLDKTDLENYLKKDGTILLLCLFKNDGSEYKIYYAGLLPYNIRNMLKQYSSSKIKIDMKEIISSSNFENICRNFNIDRNMQKGIKENIFNESNLLSSDCKTAKFYLWDNDPKNFNPQKLVGTWKYIYTLDENGYAINISYGELTNLVENLDVKIFDKDKEYIYDDVKLETLVDCQKVIFGKAFSFNLTKKNFNIKICGTLSERIKQLKFISKMFKNELFLINEIEFKIDSNKEEEKKFNNLLSKYIVIDDFFRKHNISKDINLDNWEDKDFNKLSFWIAALEEKKAITLNSSANLVGSIDIKDIRLSIFARRNEDKKFEIESLWNNNISKKYYFKYSSNLEKIETNNFYLVLNSEAYQSDDINILEMQKSFEDMEISDGEYILMNMQVLEILKAYDITKNEILLNYAEYLIDLLLKHDFSNPIYYINYVQILKRQNKISDDNLIKLVEIKEQSDETEIKLACNILLDNKNEVKALLKTIDSNTLEIFKQYPISIYLH